MATTTHSGSQSTRSPRRLQHHRSRSWLTTLFKKQVAAAGDTAGREPSEDQDDARQAWGTTIEYEARGDVLQEDPLYSQQQSSPMALPSPVMRPQYASLPTYGSYVTPSSRKRISTEQATAHWDVELAQAELSWKRASMREGSDKETYKSRRRALNRSFSAPIGQSIRTDSLPNMSLVWESLLEEAYVTIDEGHGEEELEDGATRDNNNRPAITPFLPSPSLLANRRSHFIQPLVLAPSPLSSASTPSDLQSTFSPHSPSPPSTSSSSPASIESIRFYGLAITDADIEYDSSLLASSNDGSSDTSLSSIHTSSPQLPHSTAFSEGEFSPFPAYPGDGMKKGWTPVMVAEERGWGLEWGKKSMYKATGVRSESEASEGESDDGSELEVEEVTLKFQSMWEQERLGGVEEGRVEYGVAY